MAVMDNGEIKKVCALRFNSMLEYTKNWEPMWKQLRDYIYPNAGRFEGELENQGERLDNGILDSIAGRSLRVLVSGFQSGMTSPSRPWIRLTLADTELSEYKSVREWLDAVRDIMLSRFRATNFYDTTQNIYRESALFGTACVICEPDLKSVFRFRHFTCGEYMIDTDHTRRVNCVARKFKERARGLVAMFGENNVPESVLMAYRDNDDKQLFEVRHIITENSFAMDKRQFGWANKPYISVYWLQTNEKDSGILSVTGYEEQPFAAPRWGVIGSDIYGKGSPGWEILGDCKQLQTEAENKLTQLDMLVNPPLNAPDTIKAADRLPGGFTFVPPDSQKGVWPMFQVSPQLEALRTDINDVKTAIREGLFEPLFLSVIAGSERQMTAREIIERHEEKLMMLSPVLDSLQNEFLSPVIDRVFSILFRGGYLPPAPPELSGINIDIEYIGIFTQAQKMIETQKTQDVLLFAGAAAQYNADLLDKIDFDKALDVYAEAIGVDSSIIRDKEEVEEIREARAARQAEAERIAAQQQQAEQMGKTLPQLAQSAKTLSETNVSDSGSALGSLMSNLGGTIV